MSLLIICLPFECRVDSHYDNVYNKGMQLTNKQHHSTLVNICLTEPSAEEISTKLNTYVRSKIGLKKVTHGDQECI